jgi:PncC family amidohydrolase
MVGAALTAVPGSSAIYKGGVISYVNEVKHKVLGVSMELLEQFGAVSQCVVEAMAAGVREVLNADVGVSVTGLAGPGGDNYGNPVGMVYVGYADANGSTAKCFHFSGDREAVRLQAAEAVLRMVIENNQ